MTIYFQIISTSPPKHSPPKQMGDVNMNSTQINAIRPKQVNQQVPQYDPRCDLLKAIRDGWYYVIIQKKKIR